MKNVWINSITPPENDRAVIVKCDGYPDLMTGIYSNGTWFSSEFSEDGEKVELPVTAWRDFPEYVEDCPMSFRTANEARYLSRRTLQLEENGKYDRHFFEVRALIIKATSIPNVWSVNIGKRPQLILDKLKDAGFTVEEIGDTYEIRWDI